jgi:tetratricopeptide (TPR) repeat protein
LGEIVRADKALASRAVSTLDQRGGSEAPAALARAAISEAIGDRERAKTSLASVNGGPLAAVAIMKLGLLALAEGREAEAVTSFERALHLDSDGAITNAIAFNAPGPRSQLIILYGRNGRDLAAIRLAEGEPEGPQSLFSSAVRTALTSGEARAESRSSVSFEPSLEIIRSRSGGLKTIAELNGSAASSVRGGLLASLVESAARLGQYDRAIAVERLRAAEALKPEEKTAIEKRLAEIVAVEKLRQSRLALLARIDRSNAIQSIYAARVLGN